MLLFGTQILTIVLLLTFMPLAQAACPSSVAVGSPGSPIEIGSFLKDDPDFAKMHLTTVNRMLPVARQSCQQGVTDNCLLASFLAKAKTGLECHAGLPTSSEENRNQPPASSGTPNTGGQILSGSARDMARPSSNNQQAGTSRFQSQTATHCVEVVPKGFKCDGPNPRYLTNVCNAKISVWWKVGSDQWGLQELSPGQCYTVDNLGTDKGRTVQYKACSWDTRAGYGPLGDPCRYN